MKASEYPEEFEGVAMGIKPHPERNVTIIKDEIEVSAKKRDGHNAPCNICLTRNKWRQEGILVADSEGWLFLVGSDCAKKHFGDAVFNKEHRRYRADEEEKTGGEFLLKRIDHIPDLVAYAQILQRMASETSNPHSSLHKARKAVSVFRKAVDKDDGWLSVEGERSVILPDGRETTEGTFEKVARIRGRSVLKGKNVAPDKASEAVEILERFGSTEDERLDVIAKAEEQRKLAELATAYRHAVKALHEVREIVQDFRVFFGPENFKGLEAWAEHRKCPLDIIVTSSGNERTLEVDGMRRRCVINVKPLMEELPDKPACMD
ncbi:hypothetical protein C6W92_13705 [Roseovarius sp. A46]|nr:hypothetical protein C6W92_13705 [Roseovarius sp. A46]